MTRRGLLGLALVTACGGPTSAELVGVYRVRWTDLAVELPGLAGSAHRGIELEIELCADGTFRERLGEVDHPLERQGTWRLSGSQVSLEPETGETQTAAWETGELRLQPSGNHLAMTLHRTD